LRDVLHNGLYSWSIISIHYSYSVALYQKKSIFTHSLIHLNRYSFVWQPVVEVLALKIESGMKSGSIHYNRLYVNRTHQTIKYSIAIHKECVRYRNGSYFNSSFCAIMWNNNKKYNNEKVDHELALIDDVRQHIINLPFIQWWYIYRVYPG
jgi:hypothetical protein